MLQQNGIVECEITATDHNHAYAMLLAVQSTKKAQSLQGRNRVMDMRLSNLAWNQWVKDIPNDLFDWKQQDVTPGQFIKFGQIDYVTIWKWIKKKLVEKSIKCILADCSDGHSGDTYWMYDPATTVRNMWDVQVADWMQQTKLKLWKFWDHNWYVTCGWYFQWQYTTHD